MEGGASRLWRIWRWSWNLEHVWGGSGMGQLIRGNTKELFCFLFRVFSFLISVSCFMISVFFFCFRKILKMQLEHLRGGSQLIPNNTKELSIWNGWCSMTFQSLQSGWKPSNICYWLLCNNSAFKTCEELLQPKACALVPNQRLFKDLLIWNSRADLPNMSLKVRPLVLNTIVQSQRKVGKDFDSDVKGVGL